MIGREQAVMQTSTPLRLVYNLFGDFRYPIALRGHYLNTALPKDFQPKLIWDAGCGFGQTTFYLARRYPQSIILGTDVFDNLTAHCRSIQEKLRVTHVNFECQNMVESRFNNQFDLITCFEALEHIEDYQAALEKLAAALRPGGIIVLHTPADVGNYQSETFGLRKFRKHEDNRTKPGEYHVRPGFKLNELQSDMLKQGLQIIFARYTTGPLAMYAHTLYEFCRDRTILKLLSFLLLTPIGILDYYLPQRVGGSIMIMARK